MPTEQVTVGEVARRVDGLEHDLEVHRKENREAHADLYQRLDRPPNWMTILWGLCCAVAGAGWGALLTQLAK